MDSHPDNEKPASPSSVKWVDDVPTKGFRRRWRVVYDELRNRPGEWAQIATYPISGPAEDLTRHMRRFYKCEASYRRVVTRIEPGEEPTAVEQWNRARKIPTDIVEYRVYARWPGSNPFPKDET